jgi:cytochrome c
MPLNLLCLNLQLSLRVKARHSATFIAAIAVLTGCGQSGSAPDAAAQKVQPSSSAPQSAPTPTPVSAQAKTAADPLARGAKLYKRCVSCHTLKEGERHKVGPNLWAIYGAAAGKKEGFAYSKAMKASGLIWDDETLGGYIENPRKFMPGNRMTYAGLRKEEDRKALLLYLKDATSPPSDQ